MPGRRRHVLQDGPGAAAVDDQEERAHHRGLGLHRLHVVRQPERAGAAVEHGAGAARAVGRERRRRGLACVERYLVTQAQQPVKWDAITFNFGLHDLDNSSAAEALYSSQLFNITTRLLATGAKLLYLTTTPFMPKRMLGDTVVEQLNVKARAIMDAHAIPVLDLYALVVAHCGPVPYADCDWCRRHPCSYHYDAAGMDAQAIAVANAVEGLLSER